MGCIAATRLITPKALKKAATMYDNPVQTSGDLEKTQKHSPHTSHRKTPPPNVVYVEKPRKKKWPWVLGIIGILILLLLGGCAAIIAGAGKAANDAVNEMDSEVTVELRATSNGAATVAHGASNTENITATWDKTVEKVKVSDGYSLSVTPEYQGATEVSCKITVNGVVQDEKTGSGENGMVTCTLPLSLKK